MIRLLKAACADLRTLGLLLMVSAVSPAFSQSAQPGFTLMTGTHIYDLHSALLASGQIRFTPVSCPSGGPVGFRVGGSAEGQGTTTPYQFPIVNGVITADGTGLPPQLPDTALTYPPNIGYSVQIIGALSSRNILGPGYGCVQPTGATWNFDTFNPNQPAGVTVQQGPAGPQGIPGPAGTGTLVVSTGDIYVNSTQSLDAALAICPSLADAQCVIRIAAGTYTHSSGYITRSNITIIGSGMPNYDNITGPTKLVGGSIISPGLIFTGASNVHLSNFGVDDGPAYVGAGGAVSDGVVFDGLNDPTPTDPLWHDNSVENVVSLGSGNNAAAHAFRFEHGDGLYLNNLLATYDQHCIAIKASGVRGGNFSTQSCHADQVVLKADTYTDVSNFNLSGITLKSLVPFDSQNGVVIDNEAAAGSTNYIRDGRVNNITSTGLYSPLTFLSNAGAGVPTARNIGVDGVIVHATYPGAGNAAPTCVQATGSSGLAGQDITVSHLTCLNEQGTGPFSPIQGYLGMANANFDDWIVSGAYNGAFLTGTYNFNGYVNTGAGPSTAIFQASGGSSTVVNVAGLVNQVAGSVPYSLTSNETVNVSSRPSDFPLDDTGQNMIQQLPLKGSPGNSILVRGGTSATIDLDVQSGDGGHNTLLVKDDGTLEYVQQVGLGAAPSGGCAVSGAWQFTQDGVPSVCKTVAGTLTWVPDIARYVYPFTTSSLAPGACATVAVPIVSFPTQYAAYTASWLGLSGIITATNGLILTPGYATDTSSPEVTVCNFATTAWNNIGGLSILVGAF